MKNNICFKLFTLVFMFVLFSIAAFANETEPNILTKIVVEPTENNSFNFNLFFSDKFTGNAFLQKKEQGTYYVFIPDTVMNPKKTKLIYVNNGDSNIVKVGMEEKPFVKENSQSNYVKLTVNIANDYAIRLLAKTDDGKKAALPFSFANFYSLLIIVSLALILLILSKSSKSKNKYKSVSYTHCPQSYLSSPQDYIYSRSHSTIDNFQQKPILPKVNIKKNLKTADSDSFSCFDIPLVEEPKQSSYEFKSTLKQTSNLMKERTSKSKQTNPIQRKYTEENNEFSLPVVDDLPESKIQQEEKKQEPELLSTLNITPNKGFYLTTADNDTFALFGFVGENVILLKKFNDLSQINLQARYYDRSENGNDLYIVRMDSYKAMVEISNSGMREMAVL